VVATCLLAGACGAPPPPGNRVDPTAAPTSRAAPSDPSPALPSGECRGWAASLASTDIQGAQTPEEAANSTRYGVPVESAFETTMWTTTASSTDGVTLAQAGGSVQVSRLPNGGWYVMSGQRCS
jgi:hypothetical protein